MFKVPEVVIFDLDDTLYDYEVSNRFGEKAIHEFLSINLTISEQEVEILLQESRLRVKERLGKSAQSHSRLLYVRDFLIQNKLHMHATFALECEQVFWRAYLNNSNLFIGVNQLLTFLRLSKTKLVLVTDLTSQIQLRKLAWLGLGKTFELIITAEEAGGDKETGLPELLLREFVTPVHEIWSIGDKDWDHFFPNESKFFKKVVSGKIRETSQNRYEFSNFEELLGKIER
jgi:putative hydrolase of the HAD superfamily